MSGLSTLSRRAVLIVATTATALTFAPVVSAGAAPSVAATAGYAGSAFGTSETVAGVVTSGQTSSSPTAAARRPA